jgi:lipid II:glycine glycyltransferase (peptidoglycan interpeptide bridge formation enzyme)
VYDRNALVGGCLVQRRKLFGVLRVCYVPYGPLIDQSCRDAMQVADLLLNELAALARSSVMTFIQPPEGAEHVTHRLLERGFRPSDAGIAPVGSYRVDLTRSTEEIRGGFSKRLKSWTNRWQSNGITVRIGDDRDIAILSGLISRTAARQGFTPPSLDQLRCVYREFEPIGHAALFIGEVNGDPVAADLVTMLGATVRGRRCGFDSSGAGGRFSVPAAVRWEIIKWAKGKGYRWLDFGGLPRPMLDDMIERGVRTSGDWPSAHRAKVSFNGVPFRYPMAVEFLRPTPIRWCYDLARGNAFGRRLINTVKSGLRVTRSGIDAAHR